jgi:hypothetical protein
MKTIAISQSNYIPWKGYFDMIARVDEFVLYDDVQFTRRDWRTRNQIKTAQGLKWLTIPVQSKGNYHAKINTIRVADKNWAAEHWQSLRHSYTRAPFFKDYAPAVEELYQSAAQEDLLSKVNYVLIEGLCRLLGVKTKLSWSMEFQLEEGKNERLISICLQAGATRYLSGPAAKSYVDESQFRERGIEILWMDYSGYPEYPQLFGDFEHAVSVLDVLFNTGPSAAYYIRANATHSGGSLLPSHSQDLAASHTSADPALPS